MNYSYPKEPCKVPYNGSSLLTWTLGGLKQYADSKGIQIELVIKPTCIRCNLIGKTYNNDVKKSTFEVLNKDIDNTFNIKMNNALHELSILLMR